MKSFFRGISFYILIFLIILSIVYMYGKPPQTIDKISFSKFILELRNENFQSIEVIDNTIKGTFKSNDSSFETYVPSSMEPEVVFEKYILPQIEEGKVDLSGQPPAKTPWIMEILPSIVMILIFAICWIVFMQQSQGGGRVMSFGKSRAKLHKEDEQKKVTFKDVAGLDEEKEELEEIVDFLKNPKKYIDLGARIPKGILMVGPPGTGKTYLSKATAGEAGVPFFSISGSDFVEMFVGVGASRVRDLFEQAKKNSPCIVFIDEIDAVGRKRGAGLGGGHDEREQTLNQLLVEMDGFGVNEGIIIIAATNRPDILDPALLRPGRFDRQVVIGVPDIKGREAIFKVHSKNKPLDKDVEIQVLARRTPGFTPADIENLMNEAALLTARKNRKVIKMDIIEEAITKVIAGPEKRSRVISESEKKLTAYHEAGHALVAHLLPNTDPVHQITIIPRGRAGGFTMILPKEDKYYATKTEMKERIVHLLGGRAAEQLVLNEISTGASNDLERATDIARAMVTKYGMSEKLGPVNYASSDEVFLGKDFSTRRNYSEELAFEIDKEIKELVEEAYERAKEILSENIDKLHEIANKLLEVETIDAEQFEAFFAEPKDVNNDESAENNGEDDTKEADFADAVNNEDNIDETDDK
ncbi:MAG: ATP-dependent metallopeptidase FtsH/Yme1/Tma family protein [Clostridiales bacterium]|nr:ATP-dependent metallopeptidase FtsH/Yme1/Tma family protein [Clostridiales bacterium]